VTDATLPPAYPRDLERRLRLLDGREVLVRPVLPSDAPELASAFRRADPETLHRRFLSPPPLLTGRLLHAVVVEPAWRRVGLATALVELLAEAALDRGVHTFTVTYLAENRPVASLVAATGGGRQQIRSGIAESVIALDRARVEAALDRWEV
jgi:GNAT superfamily N-acetyltransferase